MKNLRDSFEPIRFTQEEKMDLAAQLAQAAEQEEDMTDSTKRKIKKISGGMVFGVAAALTLSVGALAAAIGPSLHTWFDTPTTGAQEWLDGAIAPINRTLEHNGWTMTLTECVGDDYLVYLWVDVTAPEGTELTELENGWISVHYKLTGLPDNYSGTIGASQSILSDENPLDNKVSFCLRNEGTGQSLRGETVDIVLKDLADGWWENPGTDRAVRHERELTGAIADHEWVFEAVTLDYPQQTISLAPEVEIPYLDGTATLSEVEISPLSTKVRVEGGSCYDHHGNSGGVSSTGWVCLYALDVQLHMKDGTVWNSSELGMVGGGGCEDGISPDGEVRLPYVERRVSYMENSNLIPPRVLDPTRVDYVTICGVDIPVTPEN